MATKGSFKGLASLATMAITLVGISQHVFAAEPQPYPALPVTIDAFLAQAENDLDAATQESSRAEWVHATNITPDTEWLSSLARERLGTVGLRIARQAAEFDSANAGAAGRRKLDLLKRATNVPPPYEAGAASRLAALQSSLSGDYATGSFVYDGQPISLGDAEALLAKTRDPEAARLLWEMARQCEAPQARLYRHGCPREPGGARTRLCRHGRAMAIRL
jgi:peptidyl-dipeptidase A